MVVRTMIAVMMIMIVISPGCMFVRFIFTGMGVQKVVAVGVIVLVEMVVRHPRMLMGMVMQMPVKMAVRVFMLQDPNGLAATLTKSIGQAV